MNDKTGIEFARKCDICGSGMNDGYYLENREKEYFCSDKCLHTLYAPKQWKMMYEENEGFWTAWENDDFQFIINKQGHLVEL